MATYPTWAPDRALRLGIYPGSAMTIGGLAFRTWAPQQSQQAAVVSVYAFEGVHNPTQGIPAQAVLVASNVTLTARGDDRGEQRWDKFSVLVPFSSPFPYAGSSQLHFWIKWVSGATTFVVDGVDDGGSPVYSADYRVAHPVTGAPSLVSLVTWPVVGLIEDVAAASREPLLSGSYGPWSAAVGLSSFDWCLSRVPAATGWTLAFGQWSGVPSGGVCSSWLLSPTPLATGVVGSAGLATGRIQVPAAMVHAELALQVSLTNGAMSNGLRVRVGGGL